MPLTRRTFIKAAGALAASALFVPATDLITDAEEITRQYWSLDQTMVTPKPTHWMLAGTERRWGRERVLTMSGPLPSTLGVGDPVDVWGSSDPGGRQSAYRGFVTKIERLPDHFRQGLEDWKVTVMPAPSLPTLDPPMNRDAISSWRYVDDLAVGRRYLNVMSAEGDR